MIKKLKQIKVAIAEKIAGIPSIRAVVALNKDISAKIALSLFRRRLFALAAIIRYWFLLLGALLGFIILWPKFSTDSSAIVRYGRAWLVFLPFSYAVMRVLSRVDRYRNREERHKLPDFLRYREDTEIPRSLAHGAVLLALWGLPLWMVYLAQP